MSLILSFDIGYASIGWCVLSSTENKAPKFLGTGTVTFPSDDCLASQRRALRRTRRHIRSTRQRIERMKRWLQHRGVLTRADLDKPGHPAPFLLAAAALQGHRTLSALELWTVLRWYAHNRGYDGNSRWSREEITEEDSKKEIAARHLMEKHGTDTMCETICSCLQLNPAKHKKTISSHLPYKTLDAAYPRRIVEKEVRDIVSPLIGKLPGLDEETARLLLQNAALADEERKSFAAAGIKLPKRYHGGLLFGQLVPRFDNRIISRCPITWAKTYDLVSEGLGRKDAIYPAWHEFLVSISDKPVESDKSQEDWKRILGKEASLLQKGHFVEEAVHQVASETSDKFAKVPAAKCPEFLRYRLARILANIHADGRPINKDKKLCARLLSLAEKQGRLSHSDLEREIKAALGDVPTNIDTYFKLHPDSEEALVLDPVADLIRKSEGSRSKLSSIWKLLSETAKGGIIAEWLKSKPVSYASMVRASGDDPAVIDAFAKEHSSLKPRKNQPVPDFDTYLARSSVKPDIPSGRAPYARPVLRQVVEEVLSGYDPSKPARSADHPEGEDKPEDGVLYPLLDPSSRVRELQAERPLDKLTNNHLVRHRLLILDRLITDLLAEFPALADQGTRVIVEVGRELKEFSGKTAKEIAAELNNRLKDFKSAVAHLEKFAPNLPLSGGIIRKCRIAMDLDWECPFTGEKYEPTDLPKLEREHIIPYASRNTNALHALVLTWPAVNRMKGKRTAMQFIQEDGGKPVTGMDRLTLFTPNQYKTFVDKLDTKGHLDDYRRKKARKDLLLVISFEDKELGFTDGAMTQTSHLMKLAMRGIRRTLPAASCDPIPGAVTAEIRKSWDILSCLGAKDVCGNEVMRWVRDDDKSSGELIFDHSGKYPPLEQGEIPEDKKSTKQDIPPGFFKCPNEECSATLKLPEPGKSKFTCPKCYSVLRRAPKPKDEIRGITHLHHALDAATLALTAHYFPLTRHGENRSGLLWQAMLKRNKSKEEISLLLSTGRYKQTNRPGKNEATPRSNAEMTDLPAAVKKALSRSLAESRVMQHLPSDQSGLPADANPWGFEGWDKSGKAILRQRTFVKDNKKQLREDNTRIYSEKTPKSGANSKDRVFGINPKDGVGKLAANRSVILLNTNYGIAIDPSPVIVPFKHVHDKLKQIRIKNGGKPVRVLRGGMLVKLVGHGSRDGVWKVDTIQSTDLKVDLIKSHVSSMKETIIEENGKTKKRNRKGSLVWRERPFCSLHDPDNGKQVFILPRRYTGYPIKD